MLHDHSVKHDGMDDSSGVKMVHTLTRNGPFDYTYRIYAYPNTPRYLFGIAVIYRWYDGAWEMTPWNSALEQANIHTLKAFNEGVLYVKHALERIEPLFGCLLGTFEIERFNLYKRLFSKFDLCVLKEKCVDINGVHFMVAVTRFDERES